MLQQQRQAPAAESAGLLLGWRRAFSKPARQPAPMGLALGAEAALTRPAFKIAEDGSLQVINEESAQENVTLLCEIRRKIVEKYLTLHETGEWRRLAGGISADDFKTYELPGTAVEECHKLLRERLMPLLQSGYRQGAAKRQFKPRSA